MPDIPFPDSSAGPSNSDSQMDGLTGQTPFAPADVMSSATGPAAMNGYPGGASSNMSVPVSTCPYSHIPMHQHIQSCNNSAFDGTGYT